MPCGPVEVSVVTSGHDVADARLHREVAALRRAGVCVEVLGGGDPSGAPPGVHVRTWPRATGLRRALRALALPWRAQGRVQVALDPDILVAARLRALLPWVRTRVVADIHEDYERLLQDRAWASGVKALAGRLVIALANRAARSSDLVVVADEHLLADVPDRVVLRNLPDRTMLPGPGEPDDVPRAVYVGDLRPSRGLNTMLDAIAAAEPWRLDLIGPMADDVATAFRARLANDPALGDRVRWRDRMPPTESWTAASGAWAGLLLLEDTPAFREAIPSKLYDYLVCGLPVVTTSLPRPAEVIHRTGAGAVVTSAAEAADVLRRWSEDPVALHEVRLAAAAAGGELSGESEMARFVEHVTGLLLGESRRR